MRNPRRHIGPAIAKALVASSILSIAVVTSLTPARAYSKVVEQKCKADYKNLCPQYKPSSSQLRACMESKANEISWSCIQALIDSGEVDKKRVSRR